MRQLGPLVGISHSAVHRVLDTLGPLLALTPVRRRPREQVAIVDGTLVPTRDHRPAARSKNYRYATNRQIAIDATTRLVIAIGDPQPGNRTDTVVYRSSGMQQQLAGRAAMADGGYRGNPEVIIPYRRPADGSRLSAGKQGYNADHRRIRARAEHALARLTTYQILRDYRRAGQSLAVTASGIAQLHDLALAG